MCQHACYSLLRMERCLHWTGHRHWLWGRTHVLDVLNGHLALFSRISKLLQVEKLNFWYSYHVLQATTRSRPPVFTSISLIMKFMPSVNSYLLDELQKLVLLCEEVEQKRNLGKEKRQILSKKNGFRMNYLKDWREVYCMETMKNLAWGYEGDVWYLIDRSTKFFIWNDD